MEEIRCSLASSSKPLFIIIWCGHTFMFAFSRTMYLFEANLNLLDSTSTIPDVPVPIRGEPHCQPPSLFVHWFYREKNTMAKLYKWVKIHQQMRRKSSLWWLHFQAKQLFIGPMGNTKSIISFSFKVLNTLYNNMSRISRIYCVIYRVFAPEKTCLTLSLCHIIINYLFVS